jgi:flagellar basal-body rod modification protein FlgD
MSNVTATNSNTPGAITNQSQFNQSYTQFLSMLTTELQNQDPTSPMDATQFTNQLVGFSQLEQQLQTNSNLQTIIANQQAGGLGNSLGYLGHNVIATGNAFQVQDGQTTTVEYSLASAADSATVTVTNSSGTVIGSFSAPTASGLNKVTLDGELPDGTTLQPGDYTFSVTAATANGQSVTATPFTSGAVTGIDTSGSTPTLMIGDLQVSASNVIQVTS